MCIVEVHKKNESYVEVRAERGVLREMYDYFSFYAPNYKYMPSYRNKYWDGKIRLLNLKSNLILAGLLPYIIKFCEERKYDVILSEDLLQKKKYSNIDNFLFEIQNNLQFLKIRDYQIEAFKYAIEHQRTLLVSPTACLDPNTKVEVEIDEKCAEFLKCEKNFISKIILTLEEVESLVKLGFTLKINTPTGFCKIIDVYRKHGVGRKISFEDGTSIKCSDYHLMWLNNKWVPAKNIVVGDVFEKNTLKKVSSIELLDSQYWIDFTIDADHESYIFNDIIHHNSGKSLIIYLLTRFYDTKTLIIVPTTSLVSQMASDFESYGYKDKIHKIYSGQEKDDHEAKVIVSTWQSIFKLPKSWFDKFNVVIGDEAHLFTAKSLTSIMEKLSNCKYRFGFTGTLDNSECHKLILEGNFGIVKKVTTTSELMEKGHVADLKIKSIILDYSDEEKKLAKNFNYQDEMNFIVSHKKRNKFIQKLVTVLNGNTLVLFQYVEKHGKELKQLLEKTKKKVYYIDGSVSGEIREDIRTIVENDQNSIIVASYGTLSTGVSIKNLHNIIFASPSKSKIRNLQSIGRGLRTSNLKTLCTLYDIADDLSWKSRRNYTLLHFNERIKIYAEENFEYRITRIKLIDI